MIKKVLLSGLFLTQIFANEDAKFLVIENKLFEKIETLNILEGGIKKDFIVKSTRLSETSMKKFYPEYFAYDAKECVKINQIVNFNEKPTMFRTKTLTNESEIKNEIKKIKLLQLLNDFGENFTTSMSSKSIIKSVGVICSDTLLFRGKSYKKESTIGAIKIKNMEQSNGTLYVENTKK